MRPKQNHSFETERMTPSELRSALSLAAIFFFRMFGLFMILPVFSLYAKQLRDATPLLVGIALGAYGLTQVIFQIPFGSLSDRFGRKPIITAGLLLFAIGSAVAALSDSIIGIIVGRGLQGAGAIAAAVMALAADLSREEHRTKVMALIGVSIGVAFASAFVTGPLLDAWIGLKGLFWLAALLALTAIGILYLSVPQPLHSSFHRECEPQPRLVRSVLKNLELLRLDIGILCLHLILTASFVVLPILLRDQVGLASIHHWKVYLPVLVLSVLLILPFLRLADRPGYGKRVFIGSVFTLLVAELGLYFGNKARLFLYLMLVLFFAAFNFLEANLPALISQIAPADRKGTALGIYSMSQFLGTFLGGTVGGWLYGHSGIEGVFLFGAGVASLWLVLALSMSESRRLSSHMLNVGTITKEQASQLTAQLISITGVTEAVVISEEGIAYLKVDRDMLDWDALREIVSQNRK